MEHNQITPEPHVNGIKETIAGLMQLEQDAYNYHIGGKVFGMEVVKFEWLMLSAAECIARLTAERDAAVHDLQGMSDAAGTCFGCAHSIDNHCRHPEPGKLCGEHHKYTWRGLYAGNAPEGAESEG